MIIKSSVKFEKNRPLLNKLLNLNFILLANRLILYFDHAPLKWKSDLNINIVGLENT